MLNRIQRLGIIYGVFAIVLGLVALAHSGQPSPQLAALAAAQRTADSALTSSAASVRYADSLRRVADSAFAVSDSAKVRADSLSRVASRLRGAFAAKAAVAPDTCAAVIAAADSALDAADFYADTLRGMIFRSQVARFDLERALDTTRAAYVRLQGATVPLRNASVEVVKASKPSLLSRVLPHPGLGATAGIDASGRPNVVYGVSLGWSF